MHYTVVVNEKNKKKVKIFIFRKMSSYTFINKMKKNHEKKNFSWNK